MTPDPGARNDSRYESNTPYVGTEAIVRAGQGEAGSGGQVATILRGYFFPIARFWAKKAESSPAHRSESTPPTT